MVCVRASVGVWVKMKAVDIAIGWNATATHIAADMETIPIAKEHRIISVLLEQSSPHTEQAKQFLAFAAGDKGREMFRLPDTVLPGPSNILR